MKLRMLVVPAALLAVALPAQARAGEFAGVVVAKQAQRGTLVLAGVRGIGLTVRGGLARATVGDRISVAGPRLGDGTIRVSKLRVLSHVRHAKLHAIVVKALGRRTLVATGRSVITIRALGRRLAAASAQDDHGLRPGTVADFRVRFDDDELFEEAPPVPVGQTGVVRIEGTIVTVSPFVVSLDGLPLTITVPAGTTLPAGLASGQQIELTVQVGAGNVFTLVAVDEVENVNQPVDEDEVEVKGFVTSSSATQLVVSSGGATFTFVAAAGVTLPTLPLGTFVEVRGIRHNGVITLERLRVEDNAEDEDDHDHGAGSGHSGPGGGGDDHGGGGGHRGGGGDDGGH